MSDIFTQNIVYPEICYDYECNILWNERKIIHVCDVGLRLTILNVWNTKWSRWASGSRRSEAFQAVKEEISAWRWWLHDSADYL